MKLTAEVAASTAQRLSRVFQSDRSLIEAAAGRRTGSALRLHEALKSKPMLSLPEAARQTKLSFHAAASAMDLLAAQGIAREITGKRRGRLYAYHRYLAILGEGAETP